MWWWVALVILAVVGLLYWLLIITEGTYLGTRAVVLMYDWTARRYNSIKKLRPVYEMYFLGAPLSQVLESRVKPRVLDVATGTARLPLTLLSGSEFEGMIVGLDHSLPMLREAAAAVAPDSCQAWFIQGDAHRLMFADESFDAVTCLEALEFMRNPRAVILEMLRVLKPGGTLLVTNRIGWEAWLFPGRYCRRGRLEALLQELGMQQIDTHKWQVFYDLIWAVKPAIESENVWRETDEA